MVAVEEATRDDPFRWTAGWSSLTALVLGVLTIGTTVVVNQLSWRRADKHHKFDRQNEFNENVRQVTAEIMAAERAHSGLVTSAVVSAEMLAEAPLDRRAAAKLALGQANMDYLHSGFLPLDASLRRMLLLTSDERVRPIVVSMGKHIDAIRDLLFAEYRDEPVPESGLGEVDRLEELLRSEVDKLYDVVKANFQFLADI